MTDREMICPNYEDSAILGEVDNREKWVPELFESEIYSELCLRAKGKSVYETTPYEDEASIIEHLESYLERYKKDIKRELGLVAQGKRKGWSPETIKFHREIALYHMTERDKMIPRVQRRKKELIDAVVNGKELEMPRRINDGR